MLRTPVSGIRCANRDCASYPPAMASCVAIVIDFRASGNRMKAVSAAAWQQ